MNFGAYPRVADITPKERGLAVKAKGKEVVALEKAMRIGALLVGHPLKLEPSKFKVEVKEGGAQLPGFPVCHIRVVPEVGTEIDSSKYLVDEDNGLIFGRLDEPFYYVYADVGYRDGRLPSTVQFLLKSLASYYLIGSREDWQEVLVLRRVWKGIRARLQEQRDELVKAS